MFVDVNPADIEQFKLKPIINVKRYIKSGQWKLGGAIIKISLIRLECSFTEFSFFSI